MPRIAELLILDPDMMEVCDAEIGRERPQVGVEVIPSLSDAAGREAELTRRGQQSERLAAEDWRERPVEVSEGCCQTEADQSQKSGRATLCSQELTPLGERFVAERLEARPAFERSVVVEGVVDLRRERRRTSINFAFAGAAPSLAPAFEIGGDLLAGGGQGRQFDRSIITQGSVMAEAGEVCPGAAP